MSTPDSVLVEQIRAQYDNQPTPVLLDQFCDNGLIIQGQILHLLSIQEVLCTRVITNPLHAHQLKACREVLSMRLALDGSRIGSCARQVRLAAREAAFLEMMGTLAERQSYVSFVNLAQTFSNELSDVELERVRSMWIVSREVE